MVIPNHHIWQDDVIQYSRRDLRKSCDTSSVNIMMESHERNIMMTSSNENMFRVTGPLCGEFTGPGVFPAQRPVTRSFDVFFDLRLNKRLSKQPWGWWFETPSWSLWRQCNDICHHRSHHCNAYLAGVLCNACCNKHSMFFLIYSDPHYYMLWFCIAP